MDFVFGLRNAFFHSDRPEGDLLGSNIYEPIHTDSDISPSLISPEVSVSERDNAWIADYERMGNNFERPEPLFFPEPIPSSAIEVAVEHQPPPDVRTRTPSENRTFSVSCLIYGDVDRSDVTALKVELVYANTTETPPPRILGGTKKVEIISSPMEPVAHARFSNLSICEASTKHNEREFQLRFILVKRDGREQVTETLTNPFYAFSNQKVLARRRNIEVRCLSSASLSRDDEPRMHVVGRPFIPGPSFSILFNTPLGVLPAGDLEIYSESVAFFSPPALPIGVPLPLPAEVTVTNDGRTFSSPLPFQFV